MELIFEHLISKFTAQSTSTKQLDLLLELAGFYQNQIEVSQSQSELKLSVNLCSHLLMIWNILFVVALSQIAEKVQNESPSSLKLILSYLETWSDDVVPQDYLNL